ncbi:MAG: hypothetical protein JST35_03170 [Armatimonadetes bacterium]|nr:hypothetical protein [Armatimonadota bacterium]
MKSRRRRLGYSLIEILFAVFLLAAGASVVVASLPAASTARARAQINNIATGLAQKQLEAIRGTGYANLTPSRLLAAGLIDSTTTVAANTYAFTLSDASNNDSVSSNLNAGVGTVKIEQVDLDLRRVTVTVQWNERRGTQTVTVGTLVANL